MRVRQGRQDREERWFRQDDGNNMVEAMCWKQESIGQTAEQRWWKQDGNRQKGIGKRIEAI